MMSKKKMSTPMHLLLDKNIARRYLEGVSALARGELLAVEERQVVFLVHQAANLGTQLAISPETFNLLMAHGRRLAPAETVMLLRRTKVVYPTRYFKRWARRLRQRTFSREDAKILALGTFGTDQLEMTGNLGSPYASASLPDVGLLEDVFC